MRSHLPVSPMAMRSPRTSATKRMSTRHSDGDSGSPYEPATGPGNARTAAWGSNAAGSRSRSLNANRYARVAFAQRSKDETAKTATKRAALVANAVQKTPTYPIDENHAQSTTTVVMRPSAKSNTMAAIGTPKRLQSMLPHTRLAVRVGDWQLPHLLANVVRLEAARARQGLEPRGADFTYRFPAVAEAARGLSANEALIDG